MERLFLYLTNITSNFAYLIIFGILLACGLGMPLPEDIPLIASGYLIWDETLKWVPTLVITLTGVLVGDTILFFVGRKLGLKILEPSSTGKTLFKPEKIRRIRAYFRKFGGKIVFFARFVAGFRSVVFLTAGALEMSYSRFISLDMLAALISVPAWIGLGYGLGYYLGDEISQIVHTIKEFKMVVNAVLILIIVAALIRAWLKYRQVQKERIARNSRPG